MHNHGLLHLKSICYWNSLVLTRALLYVRNYTIFSFLCNLSRPTLLASPNNAPLGRHAQYRKLKVAIEHTKHENQDEKK